MRIPGSTPTAFTCGISHRGALPQVGRPRAGRTPPPTVRPSTVLRRIEQASDLGGGIVAGQRRRESWQAPVNSSELARGRGDFVANARRHCLPWIPVVISKHNGRVPMP